MMSKHKLDYPGKKHMVIVMDESGNAVGYKLMTTEEQVEEQLAKRRLTK